MTMTTNIPTPPSSSSSQQQQQQQHQLQELTVAKSELTHGDTSGLVYVQSSIGAAFLVTPRSEAVRQVEEKMQSLRQSSMR
jgi:chaperonin cofactor prefoldin